MTGQLDGIHTLITGAASGIGAACARRMARDGAQLLLADQNGDGAKSLADELGQASVQADVTHAEDIQRMLDLAYQRWGRLDVLFNNAGIAEARQLLDVTEDDWDRMLAVNLRAVFFVLQGIVALAARHLLPAIYPFGFFARDGGLMSYGVDADDRFRQSASYIDRILKGAKPAELPVQLPTKFEMVVNLKTAKALGLEVPLHLQQLADEVIE
jgi:NAD(P)-dependent dehydrogenase (short-subunit alcohol dehydrogenase family)